MKNFKDQYYDYKKGIDLNENTNVVIKVFHRAVANNDMEYVEKLVKQYKPSVKCKALYIAIKKNNFSMVKFLIDYGFKVCEKFLCRSIECDDIRIFKLLSLNVPVYFKKSSEYINRMVKLGKKDMIMNNIDLVDILYNYLLIEKLLKQFDIDVMFDIIKKYLIYRQGIGQSSYFWCLFNKIIHYSSEYKKLSELIKWYYKRILRQTLTPYNYKLLIIRTNTEFLEKFCPYMDLVIKDEASKKIYFWWIPFCYDITRESGKRMMQKNWEKTCELLQENINLN